MLDFGGREEPATEQPRAWQPLMSKEVCLQSSRSREKLATTATGSCAKKTLYILSLPLLLSEEAVEAIPCPARAPPPAPCGGQVVRPPALGGLGHPPGKSCGGGGRGGEALG